MGLVGREGGQRGGSTETMRRRWEICATAGKFRSDPEIAATIWRMRSDSASRFAPNRPHLRSANVSVSRR